MNGKNKQGFFIPGLCRKRTEAGWEEAAVELAAEGKLQMAVDGEELPPLICSPVEPMELALGRLITGGYIQTTADIASCREEETPEGLRLVFTRREQKPSPRQEEKEPAPWDEESIYRLREYVVTDARNTRSGHSLHSCTLFCDGKILCCREDISRRNTIDRAVGWAARNGVAPGRCLAFFSGRISGEMVEKAAAAGLSVLCARALPTAEAAALAREKGIVLLHCSDGRGLLRF